MKRSSLSARLLVWILPVSLATALTISLSTYLIARQVILWETQQGIAAVTTAAAAQVRAYFEQRHNDLATISQSPLFKDHYMNVEYGLSQEAEVYRRDIERMLLDLQRRARAYPRLSYLDTSGKEISLVDDDRVVKPEGRFQAPEFFAAVKRLRPGQRLVSAITHVPWYPAPIVRYGTPLIDEAGRSRGALVFAVSLSPVYESLGRLHLGSSGRSFLSARPPGRFYEELPSSGRQMLTSADAIPGTPWSVVTAVKRSDYIERLAWVSTMTFILALFASTVLVIIITRQVRTLLRPLQALAGAAETYAGGDLGVRVEVSGPGEVSALAESFNIMADRLKARTEALIESEARYRTAVENSPHAVVGLDQNFRITLWNRRAEALFGYQPTEAFGRTLSVIFGEKTYRSLKRQVETEGSIRQAEATGSARDGRRLDINLSWTGQSAGPGDAREWFVVMQDETEKKRLQSQLIQAEKMTAVGSLIAGVAHELNNPLAAVTGFAELLKDLPAKPEEKEDLRLLYESALRCRDIVQGLLLFVRQSKGARQRLSLNYVVQSTLALFEYRLIKTEGIALEVELDLAAPQIAGEFQKLQQVLVNLLGNACDSLKGRIGPRVIRVRTRAREDGSAVEIEDNGPGVPPERRELIFEPFHTTKPAGQGTGLGLSISRQIVAEFGGDLRFEEAVGGGARFTARFPPCPADLPKSETATKLPPSMPGRRVLVVDDEPELVQLMLRLLAEDGLITGAATNPRAALRKLADEEFDLVITDIDLGPSKGTELLKSARRLPRPPAFIFVTGDVLNQSLAQELAELDVPVLAKPFLRTEFLRLVRRVLQNSPFPSKPTPL